MFPAQSARRIAHKAIKISHCSSRLEHFAFCLVIKWFCGYETSRCNDNCVIRDPLAGLSGASAKKSQIRNRQSPILNRQGNATVGGLAACSVPFWTAPTKNGLRLSPSSLKKTGPLRPLKAVSGPEIVRKLCRNALRPGPERFKTSSASRIAS